MAQTQTQAFGNTRLPQFYSKEFLDSQHLRVWQDVEEYLKPWLDERKHLIQSWHKVLKKA